jgi:hypothetical protein
MLPYKICGRNDIPRRHSTLKFFAYARKNMKLTYWVAESLQGDRSESIVARTKHDCEQKLLAYGNPENYAAPAKRALLYEDAFDLFEMVTGPGGGRGMG